MTLHTSTYDYNDDLIATGAYFFIKIVEDRLKINILPWYINLYLILKKIIILKVEINRSHSFLSYY